MRFYLRFKDYGYSLCWFPLIEAYCAMDMRGFDLKRLDPNNLEVLILQDKI